MLKNFFLFFIVASAFIACSTNAITGRKQFTLMPESQLQQMALTEYQSFLSTNKVVTAAVNNKEAQMVNIVAQRVINSVVEYYRKNNLVNDLQGYNWETKLVQSNQANAWCMPGGKIVVYTGLLPITQNEAALAAVIGHEVSHALFSHGNERMSQGLATQGLGTALDIALANKPQQTRSLFQTAYGVGSQFGVLLPFSRKQELEADHYGLIWMAMAGYDPREAIGLWQRMEQKTSNGTPPEFLSTHPGPEKRIEQLQKYMPDAMKYYRPGGK
jgi:predicted Zn-dependent protease